MKSGILSRIVLLVLAMAAPLTALAGGTSGVIKRIFVRDSDGLVLVEVSGIAANAPACATHTYWVIRDENSESGKRQYALLIAAKFSGATVQIWGANRCSRWSDGEDIDVVYAMD